MNKPVYSPRQFTSKIVKGKCSNACESGDVLSASMEKYEAKQVSGLYAGHKQNISANNSLDPHDWNDSKGFLPLQAITEPHKGTRPCSENPWCVDVSISTGTG